VERDRTEDPYYDETDVESVILAGRDEEEDMDAAEAAFLRGYLGMGEA